MEKSLDGDLWGFSGARPNGICFFCGIISFLMLSVRLVGVRFVGFDNDLRILSAFFFFSVCSLVFASCMGLTDRFFKRLG